MFDAIYQFKSKQYQLDPQVVKNILPEAIIYSPEPFAENVIVGINYNKIVVYLISIIQHHKQEIDLLKQQMTQLLS